MKRILLTTAAMVFSATMASAAIDTAALVSQLQDEGYTHIEVKVGPTQTKVEAIDGNRKIETVYDNETGAVIKSETERVRNGEDTSTGVEVSQSDKDFVDGEDDDDDHRGSGHDDDDDDDDDDHSGSGHDGDDDDDHDDDHGDDHDDDHGDNSGHGSDDD